jgi:hypothetical protein
MSHVAAPSNKDGSRMRLGTARLGAQKKGAVIPPSRRLRGRAPAGLGEWERGTPSRGRSVDGQIKLALALAHRLCRTAHHCNIFRPHAGLICVDA